MTQPFSPDPETTERLVRGVKAQGKNAVERARRLGFTDTRVRQFERGLFPPILYKFAAAGIITVNDFPPPDDTAGK